MGGFSARWCMALIDLIILIDLILFIVVLGDHLVDMVGR